MSKRPTAAQPLEEQPRLKHINMEKYESIYYDNLATTLMQITKDEESLRTLSSLDECKELVKANPDLKRALASVVQENYEDLLSILQRVVGETSKQPADKSLDATFKAFSDPYIGGFPEALLETVDTYYGCDMYKNAISIIQSSGTGKSRGVAQAAQIRFSFMFNLRCPVNFTYPPPDVGVRHYLMDTWNRQIQRKYTAFFNALFTCTQELLSKYDHEGMPLVEWWYKHLNSNATPSMPDSKQTEFYDHVIEEAEKLYKGDIQDLAGTLKNSCRTFVDFLQSQYEHDDPSAHPPKVACLLVFDEIQDLARSQWRDDPEEWALYDHLLSVLEIINLFPVFSVFLTTNLNPNLWPLSPHPSPSSNQLLNSESSWLHPPVTELPFDVFAQGLYDELCEHGKSTLSETCTIDVMTRFGRPMWHSMHKRGYGSILGLAKTKLNPTQVFDSDDYAQLACLAIRIGLDFETSCEIARKTEIKLVEMYMRVVFALPAHGEYIRTRAPSEPIVAEAAAILLNGQTTPLVDLAPNALLKVFTKDLLARGEREEVVARLLWTLAHDHVLRTVDRKHGEVRFHHPIRVLDFLRALFHEDYWDEILNAKPMGDDEGPTLLEAFKDTYIHFSHFMNSADREIDLQQVYRLLLRGAALNCQRNQRSIDFLTPILFGDPQATKICRSNTSVLQAQINNNNNTAEAVYIDPTLVQTDHPVLSLIHHLGTNTSSVESTPPFQNEKMLHHRRHYQIVSRGCTSKTFGVIKSKMDSVYRMLLASDILMEYFPRSDKEKSAALIRQLEPCTGLQKGQKCAWFGKDVD